MENFVGETDDAALSRGHARADRENVVEPRGAQVTAMRFGHDDEAIVFRLHPLVLESLLAAKLDASHLEPSEEITVIDDAHLVRFGVADADGGLGEFVAGAHGANPRSIS